MNNQKTRWIPVNRNLPPCMLNVAITLREIFVSLRESAASQGRCYLCNQPCTVEEAGKCQACIHKIAAARAK